MKPSVNHSIYMQRCFQLAEKGWRRTKSNPIVGAVLVYQNRIIGEGYHQDYGKDHAEINCFASVTQDNIALVSKATLYVSLEPCSHYGKTPPCAEAIIKYKVPKVVVSCLDPNPIVAGRGVELLQKMNIEVTVGIEEEKGQELIRKFVINLQQERPYIALKWAQSIEGYAGLSDHSVWYTDEYSSIISHKLRAQHEAILVGTQTVILDNPMLNVRSYHGINPIKIVVDRLGRIPTNSLVFGESQDVFVITQVDEYPIRDNHINVLKIAVKDWNWSFIFRELYAKGITSVLVEGGPTIHKSIIKEGLWDEAHILSSKKHQDHGIRAPRLTGKRLESVTLHHDRYDRIIANH